MTAGFRYNIDADAAAGGGNLAGSPFCGAGNADTAASGVRQENLVRQECALDGAAGAGNADGTAVAALQCHAAADVLGGKGFFRNYIPQGDFSGGCLGGNAAAVNVR